MRCLYSTTIAAFLRNLGDDGGRTSAHSRYLRHLHGGVAAIARETGFKVTGCDANVYPPMSDQLPKLGIDLIDGYGADQLSLRPDVWVVGNVVSRGNPLMEAILDSGQRYLSGPQWLSENILYGKWVLAVAGTHGKTTVSAMLAWILDRAGMAPGFLIGGIPGNFGVSARHRSSDMLCNRGGRIRHGFFRQALEVRSLPAENSDSEQPRIRSCGYLRRSCRH